MTWSINWDAVAGCDGAYAFAQTYERIFGDNSTGVATAEAPQLRIWPVPASDGLNISMPIHGAIMIHDALGREVRNIQVVAPVQRIDVSDLVTGTYVMRASTDGLPYVLPFVKE